MELDDKLYAKITRQAEAGRKLLDRGEYDKAIAALQTAIDWLPRPAEQWEAATWLYGYQGDAYYELGQFEEARDCFQSAFNGLDGGENPFILLRLGECEYRLGNEAVAAQHLVGAYMLEGDELFAEEPDDIVGFLKEVVANGD